MAERPALLGTSPAKGAAIRRRVSVVELDRLVDGRGHLDLDLLVGLVRGQSLALDRDHVLAAGVLLALAVHPAGAEAPPTRLGRLRETRAVAGDGGDRGGGPRLRAQAGGARGRSGGRGAEARGLGVVNGRLVLLWVLVEVAVLGGGEVGELVPELLRGLQLVEVVSRPFQGVGGRGRG